MRRKSRRSQNNCSTCVHKMIDEQWGDLKCKKQHHRIHDINEFSGCRDYTKNKTTKEPADK